MMIVVVVYLGLVVVVVVCYLGLVMMIVVGVMLVYLLPHY